MYSWMINRFSIITSMREGGGLILYAHLRNATLTLIKHSFVCLFRLDFCWVFVCFLVFNSSASIFICLNTARNFFLFCLHCWSYARLEEFKTLFARQMFIVNTPTRQGLHSLIIDRERVCVSVFGPFVQDLIIWVFSVYIIFLLKKTLAHSNYKTVKMYHIYRSNWWNH